MNHLNPFEGEVADFVSVIISDATGKLGSVRVANANHLTGPEISFAPGDSRRQQALPIFPQRFPGAGVHEQRPLRMVEKSNPPFPPLQPCCVGLEQRAFCVSGYYVSE